MGFSAVGSVLLTPDTCTTSTQERSPSSRTPSRPKLSNSTLGQVFLSRHPLVPKTWRWGSEPPDDTRPPNRRSVGQVETPGRSKRTGSNGSTGRQCKPSSFCWAKQKRLMHNAEFQKPQQNVNAVGCSWVGQLPHALTCPREKRSQPKKGSNLEALC